MKHLTFSDKTMFVGDEVADLLVEYAAALAHTRDGDSVTIAALSSEGNSVTATMLLDTGAPIMVESTDFRAEPPDNDEVSDYMRSRLVELAAHKAAPPEKQMLGSTSAWEPGTYDLG